VTQTNEIPAGPRAPGTRSARRSRARWLWGDARTLLAVGYLVIVVLAAIFAPLLAPASPNAQNLNAILAGSSAHHWLGTDDLGRDLLSRLIYGARISLIASVLATAVAVAIGVPLGILAGYFQGWTDALLMRVTDTLLSFPAIVLAVAVTAALGPGLVHAMIAVGVVFSPTLARLARGQVLVARQRLFVSAAHTYGASSLRVMRRHILPNIVQPLIVQAAFMMGLALLAEAALSFLGLGVQPPAASWGSMLQESFQFIAQAPAHLYPPGLAIALTVLAFNALGDSLRDVLDPSGVTSRTLRPGRGRAAAGAPDPVPVTAAFTPVNPGDGA
jgi:peptide/nickel transport system permease protein